MSTVLTEAQRKQVVDNVPLVEHIVNRVSAGLPSGFSRDDLVQNGILGLISATLRFDPEQGVAFSSFAGRRIEGAIIDSLRRADWAPRSVRAYERRINQAEVTPDGVKASVRDLARELGIEPGEVARVKADVARSRLDSLDRPVATDGDAQPLSATVSDGITNVEDSVGDQEMIGYLRRGIALLPERQRVIIVGYFFQGRTMTELGQLLGVTQSRASQLKDDALRMLRAGMSEVDYDLPPDPKGPQRLTGRERAFTAAMTDAGTLGGRLDDGRGVSVVG
ncbi:MAG: sigma-70 family RNA polymerase sigma factor [Actinomycetota bacterium]